MGILNFDAFSDKDLIKLRDDVSDEIIRRNIERTPDGMIGYNLERASHFISFDIFSLEQCYTLAKNLCEAIERKQEKKNNEKE